MSDFASVLARARDGDDEAIELLMERHLPALRAFIRLRTGPRLRQREACSDLVQSVCREVLGSLEDLKGDDEGAFKGWLFGVALNKISKKREWHGAQKRDLAREMTPGSQADLALLRTYAPHHSPSERVAAHEEISRIESAFDALSDEYRDVIISVRLLGKSHREVAQETGKSEEAVRKLLSRARARLGLLLDSGSLEGRNPGPV